MRRRGRVKDDGNAREPGNGLLEQLQAFDACLGQHDGDPGDVAAWARQTGRVTGGDRVRMAEEDDCDRRGRSFPRLGVDGTWYDDDVDLEPDQFLRQFAHPFWLSLRPPILEGYVPALHIAQVAKPLAKSFDGIRIHGRTVAHKNDAVDLPGLLRSRPERSRQRPAQQEHQLAASHTNPPLVGAGQELWLNRPHFRYAGRRAASDTPDEGPLAIQVGRSRVLPRESASGHDRKEDAGVEKMVG